MNRFFSHFASLLLLLLPVAAIAQSGDVVSTVSALVLSEQALEDEVTFLSDTLCAGRSCGERGGAEAAFHLLRRFERYGLAARVQSFPVSDKAGHNVLGFLPATNGSDEWVIVAAHYDGLGVLSDRLYPGADSNASGVAVMLGLAHAGSTLSPLGYLSSRNILFVALDAKQLSMAGAQALWRSIEKGSLSDPTTGRRLSPSNVSLMVNLDILGSTLEPVHRSRNDYLIMLSTDISLQRRLTEANYRSRQFMDISYDYYGSKDFTNMFLRRIGDQKVFADNGVPSVLFTSGITTHTNKTSDTPATLDFPMLRKRALVILRWLERVI